METAEDPQQAFQKMVHYYHKLILFYIWNYIDIPILIGKFFKTFSSSHKIHTFLSTCALVTSLIAEIAQFYRCKILKHDVESKLPAHHYLALTMLVLSIIQLYGGRILIWFYTAKTGEVATKKPNVRILHLLGGVGLYICAKVQIFLFLEFAEKSLVNHYPTDQFFAMLTVTIMIVLFRVVIEFLTRKERMPRTAKILMTRPDNLYKKGKGMMNPRLSREQREILRRMRRGASVESLRRDYPHKTIMVYFNAVYDMTGFEHPGGSIFIDLYNWREVSRFMLGVEKDEIFYNLPPKHSERAFKILSNQFIGALVDNESNNYREAVWPLISSETFKIAFCDNFFNFEGKRTYSSKIKKIDVFNKKFYLKSSLQGVKWLGRYFYVKKGREDIAERYPVVVSMNKEAVEHRKRISEIFTQRDLMGKAGTDIDESIFKVRNHFESIDLFFNIKDPRFTIAKEIFEKSMKTKILLTGPFGRGLDLEPNFRGRCVILAEEGGFLPFIDLLDFLYKKAVYMALFKEEYHRLLQYIKPIQNYVEIFDGAVFEFYGDFRSSDDFFCLDWVNELYNLVEEYKFDFFYSEIKLETQTSMLKIPQNYSKLFDKIFLKKKLFGDRNLIEKKMEEMDRKRFEERKSEEIDDIGLKELLGEDEEEIIEYEFNEKLVKNISRDVDRLYVSGSDKFVKNVVQTVESLGIPRKKLFLF